MQFIWFTCQEMKRDIYTEMNMLLTQVSLVSLVLIILV